MPDMQNNPMTEIPTESPAYRISPMGIEFTGEVSFQEWTDLGKKLGDAGRCLGFLIGDWINYGEGKGPRFYGAEEDENGQKKNIYTPAMKITGLDYNTLSTYAGVARKVKFSMRVENLSFDHHRKVAPLKTDEEKRKWLRIANEERKKQDDKPMSARRLAKSILLGRVAKPEDMMVSEVDRKRENMTYYVTRIVVLWGKFKRNGVVTPDDTDTMLNLIDELRPVLNIVQELRQGIDQAEGGGAAGSHID
ncbi:hypothetical protein H5P28_15430 [Ruficoccus amylovorans]|uniref:Uncharacterized protein n=1 Tax=Ruficoccus amylovorans TaxID=1804625 RepID=A0A842HH62_9BACT|nr:hypothetical protein [Ruficoccus amylovorans]MBC2595659.1 hypothetical protein [Ruficoccus amylovorans]